MSLNRKDPGLPTYLPSCLRTCCTYIYIYIYIICMCGRVVFVRVYVSKYAVVVVVVVVVVVLVVVAVSGGGGGAAAGGVVAPR
ncbi:hypothetical protein GGS23DRAFT_569381 [Durotheca rogersii]|uniref:uncharacterized protein n=1 Tax=Durotheca rogersii TaxID=419775 RepID=UPI00221EFA9E|nr:uncharacterized protein GGS23DRAFT_569381 [Durotheca rogersii]KAI5862780.1 hypothetical protein GGS23DRAFT_569381 [Durotheca rogersii]